MRTYAVAVRWNDGATMLSEQTSFDKAFCTLERVREQRGLRAALYQFSPIKEVNGCVEMGDPATATEFSAYRWRGDGTYECVIDAPTMQLVITTLILRIEREGVALI